MSVMNKYRSTDNQNSDIILTNHSAYDAYANNLHAFSPNTQCSNTDEQIDIEPNTIFSNRSDRINENKQ